MSSAARASRHWATLARPALIAAFVLMSISAHASACPFGAHRWLCSAPPGWSANAAMPSVARAQGASIRSTDDAEPAVHDRLVVDKELALAHVRAVLAAAPKTSPPS